MRSAKGEPAICMVAGLFHLIGVATYVALPNEWAWAGQLHFYSYNDTPNQHVRQLGK